MNRRRFRDRVSATHASNLDGLNQRRLPRKVGKTSRRVAADFFFRLGQTIAKVTSATARFPATCGAVEVTSRSAPRGQIVGVLESCLSNVERTLQASCNRHSVILGSFRGLFEASVVSHARRRVSRNAIIFSRFKGEKKGAVPTAIPSSFALSPSFRSSAPFLASFSRLSFVHAASTVTVMVSGAGFTSADSPGSRWHSWKSRERQVSCGFCRAPSFERKPRNDPADRDER